MGGGSSINGTDGQPRPARRLRRVGRVRRGRLDLAIRRCRTSRRLERDLDLAGPRARRATARSRSAACPAAEWPAFSLARRRRPSKTSGLPWVDDQNAGPFGPACFPIAINNETDRRVSVRHRLSRRRHTPAAEPDHPRQHPRPPAAAGRSPRHRRRGRSDRRARRDDHRPRGDPRRRRDPLPGDVAARRHRPRPSTCSASASRSSPTGPGSGQNLQDHPMISRLGLSEPRRPPARNRPAPAHLPRAALVLRARRLPADRHVRRGLQPRRLAPGRRADRRLPGLDQQVVLARLGPARRPHPRSANRRSMFDLLGDERDLVRMRDAVRYLLGLFDHPAVQAVAGKPFPTAYTERYKRLAAVTRRNLAITARPRPRCSTAPQRSATASSARSSPTAASYDDILHDDDALDALPARDRRPASGTRAAPAASATRTTRSPSATPTAA